MISSVDEKNVDVRARRVKVTDLRIAIDFEDGRSITVPTKWYPRLLHATPAERAKVEIWDDGISGRSERRCELSSLFAGRRSGESTKSFRRWLRFHDRGEQEPIRTLRCHQSWREP